MHAAAAVYLPLDNHNERENVRILTPFPRTANEILRNTEIVIRPPPRGSTFEMNSELRNHIRAGTARRAVHSLLLFLLSLSLERAQIM